MRVRPAVWAVGALAAVTAAAFLNARRSVVRVKRLPLGRLRARLRVVQLSDLHYGPAHGPAAVRAWVNATLAQAPDVILVTGDFVDDSLPPGWLEPLMRELGRLHAPLGVFAVLGNHDHHAFERGGVRVLVEAVEAAGIEFLENRGRLVRDDVFLAGVDDLWLGRPNLDSALSGAPEDAAWLLMSHNPDLLPRVPERVDLTFSGHTHGGQIALPFLGAPYSGSSYRGRYLSGLVRAPALAHVSNGLGTTKLPVRLGAPAEIAVLDLVPEND